MAYPCCSLTVNAWRQNRKLLPAWSHPFQFVYAIVEAWVIVITAEQANKPIAVAPTLAMLATHCSVVCFTILRAIKACMIPDCTNRPTYGLMEPTVPRKGMCSDFVYDS